MDRPTKATHQETRAHNERLVLGTIYDRGPISRAEVARATGLTRTTVSDVVAGLIDSGLAREIGRGPSTGGKAPILLEVSSDGRDVIGIDLGDKVFRGAVVDLRGEIVRSIEVPVEDRDPDRALERVIQLVETLMATADSPVLGIGIGTAGLIDASTGTVLQAVNLDWRQLPLGEILRQRYHIPVRVANDSQAAALAEHLFGSERTDNLVVVKVGQGIGAGLVLGGRLFQGDGYGAGEIGHTTMAGGVAQCRCGRVGCLETLASSRAILAELADRRWQGSSDEPSLEAAVAAFQAGDPVVGEVVIGAARALGSAVAGLIGALNITRIVLVGSVAAFGPSWLDAVTEAARQGALTLLSRDTTIELGSASEDIVVRGATALLLTRELGLNVAAGRAAGLRLHVAASTEDEHAQLVDAVAALEVASLPAARSLQDEVEEVAVAREVRRD